MAEAIMLAVNCGTVVFVETSGNNESKETKLH